MSAPNPPHLADTLPSGFIADKLNLLWLRPGAESSVTAQRTTAGECQAPAAFSRPPLRYNCTYPQATDAFIGCPNLAAIYPGQKIKGLSAATAGV